MAEGCEIEVRRPNPACHTQMVIELSVRSPVHLPHPALADLLRNRVVGDALADHFA